MGFLEASLVAQMAKISGSKRSLGEGNDYPLE